MKTKHFRIYLIATYSLLLAFTPGCKKDPADLPTLNTLPVTEITSNSAKSGGNITYDGGAPVTVCGVVWGTTENPTIEANVGLTSDGEGRGEYISTLTDLSTSTKYYVRAYATNREGTAYGNRIEFTTRIQFAGGTGTQTDPYLLESPEQLDGVRQYLDKHFRQIADIDLSGYSSGAGWQPIFDWEDGFCGSLDGNGFKIVNLTINRTGTNYIGLFGNVFENSTLINLALENVNIKGKDGTGSIAGYNLGEIINCYATGIVEGNMETGGLAGVNIGLITNSHASVGVSGKTASTGGLAGINVGNVMDSYADGFISGNINTGGLAGSNYIGNIINSYATGNVSGKVGVGGLLGENIGTISNCFAAGDVSGDDEAGGLIAQNLGIIENSFAAGNVSKKNAGGLVYYNAGTITNCYATGDVSGEDYSGGLVVYSNGDIINCYATGKVSGGKKSGGLVSENMMYNIEGNIVYCYYDKETTEQDDTGKGIPKTTAEMMQQSNFENWDFTNIWGIDEGKGYPYLQKIE
jgi:hypothetical protein